MTVGPDVAIPAGAKLFNAVLIAEYNHGNDERGLYMKKVLTGVDAESSLNLGEQGVGSVWIGDDDDADSDDEEVDPRQRAIGELGLCLYIGASHTRTMADSY
mgnify:CR=1 FL=1